MMKSKQLKPYVMLWSTQALSTLGSGMTSYVLILWLYLRSGSALRTALLSVCSYAPYVLMSIFAGTLSDRWNKKKTMLVCDLLATLSTVTVFLLIKTNSLNEWHLYALNALNGLMNTIQQPASEVAATLLIPKGYYQKTSGLRSFSHSLNSILTPVLATTLFTFAGIDSVILVDYFRIRFFDTILVYPYSRKRCPQASGGKFAYSCPKRDRMAWKKPTDTYFNSVSGLYQSRGVHL